MAGRFCVALAAILLGGCGGGSSDGTEAAAPSPGNVVAELRPASADASRQPVQPVEGSYILGRMLRGAIQAGDPTYRVAAETPPGTDTVWLLSNLREHTKVPT
jgi:hypothetical protein